MKIYLNIKKWIQISNLKIKKICTNFFFPLATPNINDIRPIHHLGFQVEQLFESMDPKTLSSICFTYQISTNFAIYEHV
jgi:hypothetical protein